MPLAIVTGKPKPKHSPTFEDEVNTIFKKALPKGEHKNQLLERKTINKIRRRFGVNDQDAYKILYGG